MARNLSGGSSFLCPAKQPAGIHALSGRPRGSHIPPHHYCPVHVCADTCMHIGSSTKAFAGIHRAVRGSGGPCLPAWGSCSRRARSHHLRHCALAAPAAALALGSGRSLLAPNGELSFHVNPEKAICGVDFIWKHLPCLSP